MAGFWERRGKLVVLLTLMFLVAALIIVSMLLPWYEIDSYDKHYYHPYTADTFNTTSTIFRFSGIWKETDCDYACYGIIHHNSDVVQRQGWEDYAGEHPGSMLPDLYIETEGLLISGLILMVPGVAFLLLGLVGRNCLLWGALFFVAALIVDLIAVLAFSALHPMAYKDTFYIEDKEVPAGPNSIIYGNVDDDYTYHYSWNNRGNYPDDVPAYQSLRWGPGDGWYLAIAGILLFIPCAAILTHLARVDERGR